MGSKKRVCIIGGGVSGLMSIKCCLDEELEPICLERTDKFGGLWRYSDEVSDGQACVMKSTVINTSKEMMAFSDFPIPADFPNFMHNTRVIEYFELYAKKFDLLKHIQYRQEVLSCRRADDFKTTGQWKVKIEDKESGVEREETFDAVLLCTGHHADKNIASFPGQDEFKGQIVHTHDYRNHKGYEDKRVVVVGIGNSGGDVAVELSKICKQVYLSTRRGSWVIHRVGDKGVPQDIDGITRFVEFGKSVAKESLFNLFAENKVYLSTRRGSWVINRIEDAGTPADMIGIRRVVQCLQDIVPQSVVNGIGEWKVYVSTRRGSWVTNRVHDYGVPSDITLIKRSGQMMVNLLPTNLFNSIVEGQLNKRFDHARYGLKPSHRFNAQHPMVNDELPNRIACGSVIVKSNVRKFTETGIEFDDGSFVDNIDTVIMATGYVFGFPFLEEGVIDVKKNKVDLFKYAFPPDISPPTIAVAGFIQPWGAIMPIAELQLRWATRIFKGTGSLPPKSVMWEDIKAKHAAMAARYVDSQRHTIQVDWIPFMDEVAEQVGCKPDLWKILLKDPKLALTCFFGPCTPYQYRLQGPIPWKGARKAILTQWERVEAPLKTRAVEAEDSSNFIKYLIIGLILAIVLMWIM